ATTMSRLKLEDLAQESTAVARLRCLGSKSQWEQGEIWTETKFEVVQREKGVLPGIVTVRLLGGNVAHLHSHVDEVPVFQAGEEVYLFLWGGDGDPYQVLGWSQGTFRIARNPQSGLEIVTQDSASTPVFDPQTRAFRRGGIRNLPVAIFREKLHKALRQENK
ncbi:MAG: hypothetical protein WCA40_09095, partial [Candidatus Acidiferrum sp.]